jgi:membrane protease YdiL (CAAX protease family)
LSLLILPLGALAIYGVAHLLGLPMVNSQLPTLAPRGLSWAAVVVLLLLGGLLVPFAEELYFRGVLYTFCRERWGVSVAALISSLVFAVIHFDILVAAMAFFLGLFCALAYERSRSLWAAILIHALSNTIKLVFVYGMLAQNMKIPWF